jgi:hypothetical protein
VLAAGATVDVATGAGTLRLERVQLGEFPEESAEAFAARIGLRRGERLGEAR